MIQSLPMSSGEISPSQGQQHRPFIRLTVRFHDPRAQALVIHLVAAVFLEQFSVERAHVGNENPLGTDSHGLSGRAPHNLVRDPMDRVASRLPRSEEHTSELQSLLRISYAVFCLKTKYTINLNTNH